MANLRYAHILFKDKPAGILKEEPGGGTSFTYDADCSETIGCVFPRQNSVHAWRAGLLPFFQHISPEGWLRNRQARTADVADEDDFGILLAYGHDCIGAVSVHAPDGVHHGVDLARLDAMTRAAVQAKRTISGIQPKLFANLQNGVFIPAEESGPAAWIAKFPSDKVAHMTLNEALSLRGAGFLLGSEEVTSFKTGCVEGIGETALLVERFDRTAEGGKLRMEDFAQILDIPRGNDFSGKYNSSFEAAAEVIVKNSASPRIDLFRFFRRIVAFVLLGNCDCHLKNWSLLEKGGGLRLSPVYDVMNTCIYAAQGYSTEFGLAIGNKHYEWDRVDKVLLQGLGRRIGLNAAAIEAVFAEFIRKQDALLRMINPHNDSRLASDEFRNAYVNSVLSAYGRIS